jgi:hypothetical protein
VTGLAWVPGGGVLPLLQRPFCRHAFSRVFVRSTGVCVARLCVRAPRGCLGPAVARTATGGITSVARGGAGGHVCVFAIGAIDRSSALAAGVTWTSRTTSAQWAARAHHTSVVDAAGAIYVIGGGDTGGTFFQDVWTDGGA